MSDVVMRALEGDERLEVMYALTAYALEASPPLSDKEEWIAEVRHRQGVVYWAVFEDGMPASGAAATDMIQNVRGRLFDAHGVWAVATAPAFRRRGYCRQAISALLCAGRDAGQVFSTLYPFRESFYERLGYVAFPLARIVRFAPAALVPLLGKEFGGRVDVRLSGEGYDAYRQYIAGLRPVTHGVGMFVHGDKASAGRNRFWVAFAKDSTGTPVGLMLYDLKGDRPTQYHLRALRFYYSTVQGRYLLLQWIARHIDQAVDAELWLSPVEQPELWLADLELKTEAASRPAMARVLDVGRLGGMQVGNGRFSARVIDPLCPWNEGVWRFESEDGILRVRAAPSGEESCAFSIQGLTALVFGTHDPGEFAFRGWGMPTESDLPAIRTLFPRRMPYLHERF